MIVSFLLLYTLLFVGGKSENSVEYYQNLLQNFLENASKWEYPTDSKSSFKVPNGESTEWGNYDFIIVGAGVAGSVLTNRLTESGKFKVLVLEAGQQENDFTDVPAFAGLLVKSDFNWGYKTIPQTNACLGMKNRQCNYPRGKAVGGSSVINFMVYVRGNKEDFDKWGADNPSWDYKSVLPYFKKSEKSSVVDEEYDYHGHDGPLSVEHVQYYPNITTVFLDAMDQMGRKVLDYNGHDQIGYSHVQSMTVKGRRCSGNKAFIKPAMGRKNLELFDNSLVLKVLIKGNKAYGVEFVRDGKKYHAMASKEVIVAGGSLNSPQLLMLSGIGPKEHLEQLGIPVVQDSLVGQHLHDHVIFPAMFFATNLTVVETPFTDHIQNYLNGFGVLTAAGALASVGFASPRIKSSNPSVEYAMMSGTTEQLGLFLVNFLEVTQENWLAISKPIAGKICWLLIPILLHPKSTGTIKLKSKDPLDFPLMDSNLNSDGDDIEEMLSVIKDILDMSKMPAFQAIDSQYLSGSLPACTGFVHLSDDYWRCALKQLSFPILHAVGTCKMGPKSDKTAVVDSKLKVYKVEGLRVADASVMPFSISSHPTPSVFMIGEKAADFIREDHGDL